MIEHGGDRAGNAALHVDGAAAIELAVGELAGKRRMRPGAFVARRHHVGMAGEYDVRRGRCRCGHRDFRRRRVPGSLKVMRCTVKPGAFQQVVEIAQRAAFRRRHRRAAQQFLGDGKRIGAQSCGRRKKPGIASGLVSVKKTFGGDCEPCPRTRQSRRTGKHHHCLCAVPLRPAAADRDRNRSARRCRAGNRTRQKAQIDELQAKAE